MVAEENVEKICEEDEYVLLSCGDNYAEIYDRDGNSIGQCRAYLDEFRSACTVKNNEIVVYSDGTSITAFSMSKLENILGEKGNMLMRIWQFLTADIFWA